MTNEISPSLSYHYWMLCINGTATNPTPSVLIKGTDFDPQKEITSEDDEGHTGTATTKISTYRSNATSSPQFQDKCRYQEGWEDILYLLIGSDDGSQDIDVTEVSTGVYKYIFHENPNAPMESAFATVFNGFNKTTKDGYKYKEALMNTFKLSGSNSDAPTYEVQFASDFPLFHQTNLARVFPKVSNFPKSGNTKLYIAPLGTEYDDLTDNMQFSCYESWEINVNKNVESKPCADDTFGTSTKVTGSREGDFSCTLPWNSRSKQLEYEFMGGDTQETTTTVTDEDVYKTIYLVMSGGKIIRTSESDTIDTGETIISEDTSGSTTIYTIDTGKTYNTIFKLPEVVLTDANSPQSGSDAKTIDISANIVDNGSDSFVEVTVQTGLEELHISDAS